MIVVDPLQGAWELPKKLKDWGEQCSPVLENPCLSHINFERTPVDAMSIGRLLLPEFIEYQDAIFLKSQFSDTRFLEWLRKLKDLSAIEKVMNHIHVYDIFGYSSESTDEEFLQVANLLRRSWSISLAVSFPNYLFDVTLQNTDQDYGPVVSFYKKR